MKKLSQRELLDEGIFMNAVRSAGRALKSVYSPVFEPIAPVAKGIWNIGNRPTRVLKQYLSENTDIRLVKVNEIKKVTGDKREKGYGRYFGPEIYQIFFTGQQYNKSRGIYEAVASTLPPPTHPTPTYTPPPAASYLPAPKAPAPAKSEESTPKKFRADISEIKGNYKVIAIYEVDEKGKVINTYKSPKTNKSNKNKTP
jgi:hypothetical protein